MSGQPAARVGDPHVCPAVTPGTPPIPHVGGPILPAGAVRVMIGGQPAARMGDQAFCAASPPTPVMAGAFPVPIQSNPAARQTDATAHGGTITVGFPTVLIGLSGTTGNPRVGSQACQAAAAGRTSGATQQSYNNCGVESSRQLINQATGANVSENALLTQAIQSGNANGTPGGPLVFANGGTGAPGRQAILAANGVPSTVEGATMTNLGLATSRSQGVIANIDAALLWGPPTPPGALHAIAVTGVEYDDAGNPTNVIVNDTGTGNCGQRVPISQFRAAQAAHPNPQLNVTTNPIW